MVLLNSVSRSVAALLVDLKSTKHITEFPPNVTIYPGVQVREVFELINKIAEAQNNNDNEAVVRLLNDIDVNLAKKYAVLHGLNYDIIMRTVVTTSVDSNSRVKLLYQELDEKKWEINSLQKKIKESEKKIKESERKIKESEKYEKEYNELKQEHEKLKAEHRKINQEHETLNQHYEKLKQEHRKLQEKCKNQEAQLKSSMTVKKENPTLAPPLSQPMNGKAPSLSQPMGGIPPPPPQPPGSRPPGLPPPPGSRPPGQTQSRPFLSQIKNSDQKSLLKKTEQSSSTPEENPEEKPVYTLLNLEPTNKPVNQGNSSMVEALKKRQAEQDKGTLELFYVFEKAFNAIEDINPSEQQYWNMFEKTIKDNIKQFNYFQKLLQDNFTPISDKTLVLNNFKGSEMIKFIKTIFTSSDITMSQTLEENRKKAMNKLKELKDEVKKEQNKVENQIEKKLEKTKIVQDIETIKEKEANISVLDSELNEINLSIKELKTKENEKNFKKKGITKNLYFIFGICRFDSQTHEKDNNIFKLMAQNILRLPKKPEKSKVEKRQEQVQKILERDFNDESESLKKQLTKLREEIKTFTEEFEINEMVVKFLNFQSKQNRIKELQDNQKKLKEQINNEKIKLYQLTLKKPPKKEDINSQEFKIKRIEEKLQILEAKLLFFNDDKTREDIEKEKKKVETEIKEKRSRLNLSNTARARQKNLLLSEEIEKLKVEEKQKKSILEEKPVKEIPKQIKVLEEIIKNPKDEDNTIHYKSAQKALGILKNNQDKYFDIAEQNKENSNTELREAQKTEKDIISKIDNLKDEKDKLSDEKNLNQAVLEILTNDIDSEDFYGQLQKCFDQALKKLSDFGLKIEQKRKNLIEEIQGNKLLNDSEKDKRIIRLNNANWQKIHNALEKYSMSLPETNTNFSGTSGLFSRTKIGLYFAGKTLDEVEERLEYFFTFLHEHDIKRILHGISTNVGKNRIGHLEYRNEGWYITLSQRMYNYTLK